MKKIISLLLALCLLSACVLALAAESKTAGDVVVTEAEPTEGEAEETIITLEPAPAEILAEFQAIGEDESILTPFSNETQQAARSIYANADNMDLIELNSMAVNDEEYAGGTLDVALDYDEDFNQFDNVLVIMSANENELVVAPEITEEGDLKIDIPEEFVKDIIADANAFLAVLGDKDSEETDALINLAPAADEINAKFQAIGEGESILTPFDAATQDAARAIYANADDMNLVELSAISIDGDKYVGGPLEMTLDNDEDFNKFNNVLVIMSANENDFVAEPEITEEGNLKVEITEEFVQNILADANAFVAVLAD